MTPGGEVVETDEQHRAYELRCQPLPPHIEPTGSAIEDFRFGLVSAAECAAGWPSTPNDLSSEDTLTWVTQRLFQLRDVGTTWKQYRVLLDGLPPTTPIEAPAASSIQGSGIWKPNAKLTVFVDVDGVVSPVPIYDEEQIRHMIYGPLMRTDRPISAGWPDWATMTRLPNIPIAMGLIEVLVELSCRPDFEVSWLTSWEENANWILEDLGFDERFPVNRFDYNAGTDKWSTVIDHHHRRNVPFVWLEDYLGTREDQWSKSLDVDSLLIRPNTYHGITRECWDHIETWIGEHIDDLPPPT